MHVCSKHLPLTVTVNVKSISTHSQVTSWSRYHSHVVLPTESVTGVNHRNLQVQSNGLVMMPLKKVHKQMHEICQPVQQRK